MGWDEVNEVKTRRVLAGICIRCGKRLARENLTHCWPCGRKDNEASKAWHRRKGGFKPSTRRCGECRRLGHDRRRCRRVPYRKDG